MFQHRMLYSAMLAILATASQVAAANESLPTIEEVLVTGATESYAATAVSDSMINLETGMTSVLAVIDKVPGVLINEGDVLGSDDWSTTVSIRGFQLSLDEQQIGMTIDGVPNGNSNYGGGSKVNRFLDTENLKTVEVSQGTADIGSRSHEALGGTLNFVTRDPESEERLRFSYISGDFEARKYYVSYDTGTFAGDTRAYVSLSTAHNSAWIDESGETIRTHAAAKLVANFDSMTVKTYIAYDDTAEDNYQRITPTEFNANPDWDRLTGEWTGIPHIDQLYRRGWSTLRENLLAYTRFEFAVNEDLQIDVTPYYHQNEGRGDWLPPYVVDVTDDGAGDPNSELQSGNTVRGGSALGRLTFVNRAGVALTPASGCSSLDFPYGGTSNDNPDSLIYDPACFPADAIPVSSYRHTHYEKERMGLSADLRWSADLGFAENLFRAGFWYEDGTRQEWRDWHKVIDSRTAYHFDHTPYWVQFDREYPMETQMFYVEDTLTVGPVELRAGAKQWFVDIDRQDNILGGSGTFGISSDSDLLPTVGALWQVDNAIQVFAGYAENFAAVKDAVLEAASDPDALVNLEPETAENFDLGVRFIVDNLRVDATYYQIDFKNRITQIPAGDTTGIDFLEEFGGTFRNEGGIESEGYELAGNWQMTDTLSLYASYTNNESLYHGTGDSVLDAALGIVSGNTVFGSAETMYVVSLDWQRDHLAAGFSNKHVGERWLDEANTERLAAYDVADLYVAVSAEALGDALQGLRIKFTINNVFDEDYLGGAAGGWGAWIGGGRFAAISVLADF